VVESHTLNDGRQVAIRPIGPDDHERLRATESGRQRLNAVLGALFG